MLRIALALLVAVATGTIASAQPAQKPFSVVLVHGAFVDASGWQRVFDILTGDGYEVLVVQNPTISLDGDVAATERAIAAARNPVILVGHSYGGMVITQAGDTPKVHRLVYLAAYAPEAGESVVSIGQRPLAPGEARATLLPPRMVIWLSIPRPSRHPLPPMSIPSSPDSWRLPRCPGESRPDNRRSPGSPGRSNRPIT